MRKPSKDFLVVMALIGAIVISAIIWGSQEVPNFSHTKAGDVHRDLLRIALAINYYQAEQNSDPPLLPRKFYAALKGENPKGIQFLIPSRFEDSEGLRCDAWHTPYQVYMCSGGWLIRSAGPNRSFDDVKKANQASLSDDISIFVPSAIKSEAQQAGSSNGG